MPACIAHEQPLRSNTLAALSFDTTPPQEPPAAPTTARTCVDYTLSVRRKAPGFYRPWNVWMQILLYKYFFIIPKKVSWVSWVKLSGRILILAPADILARFL